MTGADVLAQHAEAHAIETRDHGHAVFSARCLCGWTSPSTLTQAAMRAAAERHRYESLAESVAVLRAELDAARERADEFGSDDAPLPVVVARMARVIHRMTGGLCLGDACTGDCCCVGAWGCEAVKRWLADQRGNAGGARSPDTADTRQPCAPTVPDDEGAGY